MSTLPPETLGHIFTLNGANVFELKQYSLVCSAWRFPAQRELFRVATFTITDLDSPSRHSIPYSKLVENEQYLYLFHSIRTLRIGLRSPSAIDPQFCTFLGRLLQVETIKFTDYTGWFLFEESLSPEMSKAFLHILDLPTLARVVVDTISFPTSLIPPCLRVPQFSWALPPNLILRTIPREDFLRREGSLATENSEINLSGDGQTMITFAKWLHGYSSRVSLDNIKRATFHFTSPAASLIGLFPPFSSITYLTLKSDVGGFGFSFDASPLVNLSSLRVETSLSRSSPPSTQQIFFPLLTWLVVFLPSLPSPGKLCTLEVEVLDEVDNTGEPFEINPSVMIDSMLPALGGVVTHQFPQLSTFSLYMPWMTHEYFNELFSDFRAINPGLTLCGPGDMGPNIRIASV